MKRARWNDLSPSERTKRVLHRWRECGQDVAEIAKALGATPEQVAAVLNRALAREVRIR